MKITKEDVEKFYTLTIKLHNEIIKQSGGEIGVRDEGGLYNSLCKILMQKEKNSTLPVTVGAFSYKELARRHHFIDGNHGNAESTLAFKPESEYSIPK